MGSHHRSKPAVGAASHPSVKIANLLVLRVLMGSHHDDEGTISRGQLRALDVATQIAALPKGTNRPRSDFRSESMD